MTRNSIAIGVFLVLAWHGCKTSQKTNETKVEEPALSCDGTNYTLQADIKPILKNHCNDCHSDGGAGGYDFTIDADILKAAKNGDLLGTVKWLEGYPKMPEGAGKLGKVAISKIECWINNGMK